MDDGWRRPRGLCPERARRFQQFGRYDVFVDNTLTVADTATLLGTDLSYTYHLIRAGRLPATKVGGKWAVDKRAAFDLARVRAARRQRRELRDQRKALRKELRAAEEARFNDMLQAVRPSSSV